MATEFISNSWLMPTNANAEANRVSNYSLDFDGSSTKISFSEITFSTASTLSAWAKRNTAANMFLFGNTNSGGYGCYFVGTSGVYVQGSGGYFAFTNAAVTTAMARTDWVNWVFIKDSSTNLLSVYVDGVLAQTTTSAAGMDSLTSIGGSGLPTGNQFIWDGNITEVSIFDYALTSSQITELYGTGSAIGNPMSLATKPVNYYPLGNAGFNGEFLVPNGATELYENFSLAFDGSNDFITTGYSYDAAVNNNLTLSFWYNSTSTSNFIFPLSIKTNGGQYNSSIVMVYNKKLIIQDRTGWVRGSTTINDGNWHNIVVTAAYSGNTTDGTTLNMYIDGNLSPDISTSTMDSGTNSYLDGTLYLGNFNGASNFCDCTLSNVAVWQSILTTAQITSLYNSGKTQNLNTFEVTPLSWWRLGSVNSSFDGTNWTVLDEISTSGNNGTSANMTQADLVDGVGATGSGTSSGMGSGENRKGTAPYSESNAVSYNMSVTAKSTSVPT